jgi:hypothetical protein
LITFRMVWLWIESPYWGQHDGAEFEPTMRVDVWNSSYKALSKLPCRQKWNLVRNFSQSCRLWHLLRICPFDASHHGHVDGENERAKEE